MVYRDRDAAARLLAVKLKRYRPDQPLVLAIPRGAVPIGRIIADTLGCELDVVLVRKIGAPDNPELALGAVNEHGDVYLNSLKERLGVSDKYITQTVKQELAVLLRRRASYTPVRPPIPLAGRTVILVDDGVATGATLLAAIHSARAARAAKVIAAAPVASQEAAELLARKADAVVFLEVPADFGALSQFYEHFSQITDDEVTGILARERASRWAG